MHAHAGIFRWTVRRFAREFLAACNANIWCNALIPPRTRGCRKSPSRRLAVAQVARGRRNAVAPLETERLLHGNSASRHGARNSIRRARNFHANARRVATLYYLVCSRVTNHRESRANKRPCAVSFAYREQNARRRLLQLSLITFHARKHLNPRDRCVPMHRACGPIPSVPFTNSDKELYLNQRHVTSRSWQEWRNRAILSRFIHIRGMRYRNCITEGHALLPPLRSPLTIQFSSSGNTRLTTRKCRMHKLSSFTPYFRNYTKTARCKSSELNRFWKQSRRRASAITLASRNKKSRPHRQQRIRSAFPSRSAPGRNFLSAEWKRAAPFEKARVAFSHSCITHLYGVLRNNSRDSTTDLKFMIPRQWFHRIPSPSTFYLISIQIFILKNFLYFTKNLSSMKRKGFNILLPK